MNTRVLVTDNQSNVLQGVVSGIWAAALFVSMEGCSILYVASPLVIENLQAEKERYSFLKKHGEVCIFSTEETESQVLSRLEKFLPGIMIDPQFFSSEEGDASDGCRTDVGGL